MNRHRGLGGLHDAERMIALDLRAIGTWCEDHELAVRGDHVRRADCRAAVGLEARPHVLLAGVEEIARQEGSKLVAHQPLLLPAVAADRGHSRAGRCNWRCCRSWRKSMGVEPTRDCWQPLPDLKSGRPTGTRGSSKKVASEARITRPRGWIPALNPALELSAPRDHKLNAEGGQHTTGDAI